MITAILTLILILVMVFILGYFIYLLSGTMNHELARDRDLKKNYFQEKRTASLATDSKQTHHHVENEREFNEGLSGAILLAIFIAFCLWLGSGNHFKYSVSDGAVYCDPRTGCW